MHDLLMRCCKYVCCKPLWHFQEIVSLQGNSSAALAQTKTDYDAFLGDAANLQAVRNALQDTKLSSDLRKTLEIMQKTFLCYITEDPQATAMKVILN